MTVAQRALVEVLPECSLRGEKCFRLRDDAASHFLEQVLDIRLGLSGSIEARNVRQDPKSCIH